jgi:hypothetical protein
MKKIFTKMLLVTFLLSVPVFTEARTVTEIEPPSASESELGQSSGIGRVRTRRRVRRRTRRRVRRYVRRNRVRYRVRRSRGRGHIH